MDCSLGAALPKPKPVSVNGVVIERDVIAREVQNHPSDKPILAWQAAARALAVRELLRQEVRRLGITAAPLRDAEGRSETEEEAAMRALIAREVLIHEPDESTCRRFYDQNRQRFLVGELYEASHILLIAPSSDSLARSAARDEGRTIVEAVQRSPELFETIARDRSGCRVSAENGGRLGQLSRGQTTAEFDAALARMSVGEVGLIETRFGIHVVRLDRRALGQVLPFDMARARISQYLTERVRHQALAQYVANLAGRAEIVGVTLPAPQSVLPQ
ncbi:MULTISPECIES: peptidylprolyl isomerase [unclassified Bradyrhizobium]|uniref:peptidylprolyl isomerase n=1 Tax=unclassified Bradyrhizobium TaxID=2631580 RepID=UPI0028EA621A|nr:MULTISPECIES: peptidylprolyl isomerase [unclassified Bradyrhizobium]